MKSSLIGENHTCAFIISRVRANRTRNAVACKQTVRVSISAGDIFLLCRCIAICVGNKAIVFPTLLYIWRAWLLTQFQNVKHGRTSWVFRFWMDIFFRKELVEHSLGSLIINSLKHCMEYKCKIASTMFRIFQRNNYYNNQHENNVIHIHDSWYNNDHS